MARRILSYCAEIFNTKTQTLPTGNRSISATGWFCLAHILQPPERPDWLVSGFTNLWHVGKSSNTTSSIQSPPVWKEGQERPLLSPRSLGMSWWLRRAQLQAVLPAPELYSSSYLYRSFKRQRDTLSLHGHSVSSGQIQVLCNRLHYTWREIKGRFVAMTQPWC